MGDYDRQHHFKEEFKNRCFRFSLSILHLRNKVTSNTNNRILLDQLTRSATSIGANVVEGGSSISKKEFISFFQIAFKSSSETIYWLSLLKEVENNNKLFDDLLDECTQIKKLLSTIIINSKKNS